MERMMVLAERRNVKNIILSAAEPKNLGWIEALARYTYPVNLQAFSGRTECGETWFNLDIARGDRSETIQFENRFREHACSRIEPWGEVIFWKMASQGGRANIQTERAFARIAESGTSAEDLWLRCHEFIAAGTEEAFRKFQTTFFRSSSIAIAFTFPAFVRPEKFPMVDTRIVRYIAAEGLRLGFPQSSEVEKTLRRYRERPSPGVLTLYDWPFVEAWIEWCRKMAGQLSKIGDFEWRARDIEMAVFRAWGEGEERGGWSKDRPCYRLL
jgi:hypothetical protein